MSLSIVEPFPLEELSRAWEWHKKTSTCISEKTHTYRDFVDLMSRALCAPGARSCGILLDGELVGMVIFDPIWRSSTLVDGSIHIVLARRAWGKYVIDDVAEIVIPHLFESIPTLQRLTGFTPSHYRAGLEVGRRLGFQREGVIRAGVNLSGQVRDIVVSGLTRGDWYGTV